LTQLLHGLPNLDIQAVNNYTFRLNHLSLVQIVDNLSTIDAKDYILGSNCIIGFDKKNNELLVTNHRLAGTLDDDADADLLSKYGLNPEGYDLNYSYVFSFESGFWHKRSNSYRILINKYPELLIQRENSSNDGIYSLSQDNYNNNITTVLTTRPCKQNRKNYFTLLQPNIRHHKIETNN